MRGYLLEKARYVARALAHMAEAVRLLPADAPVRRELSCHIHVALRYSLETLSRVTDATFQPAWVLHVMRDGRRGWECTVEPVLNASLFGETPEIALDSVDDDFNDDDFNDDEDEEDDEEWATEDNADDVPREGEETSARDLPLDEREVLPSALRSLAALLDLVPVVARPEVAAVPNGGFDRDLVHALNGATKVVSTLIEGEWDVRWPSALREHGRDALEAVLVVWDEAQTVHHVTREELAPLDQAWLVDADPACAPDVDRAAERNRRANVTEASRQAGDLVVPPRYEDGWFDRLARSLVPEHRACADFARAPRGTLVLRGEFRSAINGILWAIGRHWFVEELETVRAFRWHDLVAQNVLCQERAVREAPRLLVYECLPVVLTDGTLAHPGQADRLLAFRLERGLPTVVAVERGSLEDVNVTTETADRLRQTATTVHLPVLSDSQIAELGLEL